MSSDKPTGRFAPSPTGPLHFGSLIAALGSFAQARNTGGRWLVRIDDIDPPREAPGAVHAILHTLTRFGFEWDGLQHQSEHSERYEQALRDLTQAGRLYGCTCSRKAIAASARRGPAGFIYPGTCRGQPPKPHSALRVIADATPIEFTDRIRGPQRYALTEETGDFIVRRRDGLFAYHLACAVDDGLGIDEVVRGADLLPGTAAQIHLQRQLGLPTPRYAHLPVALGDNGRKLSKQTFAAPLDDTDPLGQLTAAWAFLGQAPVAGAATPHAFLATAIQTWDLALVPGCDRLAPTAQPG